MSTKTGYFNGVDIDFETLFVENAMLDEMFYLKDLKQRKLFITSEIHQVTIEDAVHHILQYNTEDKGIPVEERQPILLYIVSNGGSEDAGFELIDAITASKTPVYTINLGYQYSMGFLIGIAGHKRFAAPNAKYLMHDGTSLTYDSGSKARDKLAFDIRREERLREYVLSRTKITPEEYDSNLRVEWYMFADEAKEKGVTDFIIGKDCDIDEII